MGKSRYSWRNGMVYRTLVPHCYLVLQLCYSTSNRCTFHISPRLEHLTFSTLHPDPLWSSIPPKFIPKSDHGLKHYRTPILISSHGFVKHPHRIQPRSSSFPVSASPLYEVLTIIHLADCIHHYRRSGWYPTPGDSASIKLHRSYATNLRVISSSSSHARTHKI